MCIQGDAIVLLNAGLVTLHENLMGNRAEEQ